MKNAAITGIAALKKTFAHHRASICASSRINLRTIASGVC
jgi:hypothetical protein